MKKRWLVVVAGSIALVAVWALPPSAFRLPTRPTLPETARLERVTQEVARAHAALRTLRWSDSLSALLVGADDGVVLGPPVAARLEPDATRRWVDAQQEALARLPRRDPHVRVGVFWVPMRHSTLPDVPLMHRIEEVTFVGEREGTPFCFRALPYLGDYVPISSPASDLGACRLFAAYGMPGERIHAWLEASSLGFARVPVATFAADYARMALPPIEPASRLFGLDRPRAAVGEELTVQACLAGRADACERALTDPELIAPSAPGEAWLLSATPASGFGTRHANRPFGYLDDALLYEWEARYGSDAFARFWVSGEPVPQAFEAAFGEPLGAWARGWVEQHVGRYRAGPSLPWSSVWTSVLAMAALAVLATAAGMRRQVGAE